MSEVKPNTQGWAKPYRARKFHYFQRSQGPYSLCGKWEFLGWLTDGSPQVDMQMCQLCRRELERS